MRSRLALVMCALLALLAHGAVAQTVTQTTGAVNGTVTDASKAVLPGVNVTLTGPALMGSKTAITDENGFYRLNAVPTGDEYQLVYQLPGFATVPARGFTSMWGLRRRSPSR